jgi:hypothetical protein
MFSNLRRQGEWFDGTKELLAWISANTEPFEATSMVGNRRPDTCCVPGCGSADISGHQFKMHCSGMRRCRRHAAGATGGGGHGMSGVKQARQARLTQKRRQRRKQVVKWAQGTLPSMESHDVDPPRTPVGDLENLGISK